MDVGPGRLAWVQLVGRGLPGGPPRQSNPPAPVLIVLQWAEIGRFSGAYTVEAALPNGERLPLGAEEGTVSRRHARLFWQKGIFYVQDLDSFNGTYLNGQPIPHAGRGREGEPVPVPGEEAELGLGRLFFSVRIVTITDQAPTVPMKHWENFLSSTTSRDLSALFTRRIPQGASEHLRAADLFQRLMETIDKFPNVQPILVLTCLRMAFPDAAASLDEMFKWLQAERLTEERIAVLKDPYATPGAGDTPAAQ